MSMGKMEQTLAFIFHKKGGKPLSRMEMEFMLSMDLRWFTMVQAKQVVENAANGGYIVEKEGKFLPVFSLESVVIPSLFRPDFKELESVGERPLVPEEEQPLGLKGEKPLVPEEERPLVPEGEKPLVPEEVFRKEVSQVIPAISLFNRLLEHIMSESGKEKKDIIIRMNELKEMDVIPEMRLMVAASELGVDVSGFIDETYGRIKECS